jgi:hypothetical protein
MLWMEMNWGWQSLLVFTKTRIQTICISPAVTSIRTPVNYSLSLFPGLNKNEKLQQQQQQQNSTTTSWLTQTYSG